MTNSYFKVLEQNSDIPDLHRNFLLSVLPKVKEDTRILALGAGGSFISGELDEYSDLDLVVIYDPTKQNDIMQDRKNIATGLGSLLAAFTGEHVGESRLLICLYGPPLLHVDLKFVTVDELSDRVEDPVVLWERDNLLSNNLRKTQAVFPKPDLQWIEDRFWPWIHYICSKIGRGELFEAIDGLAFLRGQVLGPLILLDQKAIPSGIRKIEKYAQSYVDELRQTISTYDVIECINALTAAINLYQKLRRGLADDSLRISPDAEYEVMQYLKEIKQSIKGKDEED